MLGPKNLNRIVAQSIHTPNGHVPLYLEDHFAHKEGSGFCPLDRADGVNPGFVLREETRLVVVIPQHQTAFYETQYQKSTCVQLSAFLPERGF